MHTDPFDFLFTIGPYHFSPDTGGRGFIRPGRKIGPFEIGAVGRQPNDANNLSKSRRVAELETWPSLSEPFHTMGNKWGNSGEC